MTTTKLATQQPVELPTNVADLHALFDRANDGDKSVLPQVQKLLELDPQGAIQKLHGDLLANNEEMLIRVQANGNDACYYAIQKQTALKREELTGPDPQPLERMLIDCIIICWLQVQRSERECLVSYRLPLKELEHGEKVRDRAYRRLQQVITSLARIRKLAVPVVQINVAKRQVNFAG